MADENTGALSQLSGGSDALMGALSSMMKDPVNPERANMAYRAGMLGSDGGGGIGAALGNALGAADKVMGQQEALKATYIPHITQAMIQAQQFQLQMAKMKGLENLLGGGQADGQSSAAPMPGQLSSGTAGIVAPPSGMAVIPPTSHAAPANGYGRVGNLSPDQLAMAHAVYGADLMPQYKLAREGITSKPGTFHTMPNGSTVMTPMPDAGIAGFDPVTNSIIPVSNYNQITQSKAEASASGSAIGTNKQTIVDPSKIQIAGPIGSKLMTQDQLVQLANGQSAPPSVSSLAPASIDAAAPSSGGLSPHFLNAVISAESGGNPAAVSPKGARGLMQVMDGTNRSPGFGVTPAKDNSPEERVRVGTDYLGAMQDRYKDPALAAIAYNMGPAATDAWLANGANPAKLPPETKAYVSSVMTKTAVNQFQAQQTASQPQGQGPQTGVQVKTPAMIAQEAADRDLANKPKMDAATTTATKAAEAGQAYQTRLHDEVGQFRELVQRNKIVEPLLDKFTTGGMLAEERLNAGNRLQQLPWFPAALRDPLAKFVANGDPVAGKTVQNQLAAAGVSNMLQVLDKQAPANKAIFAAIHSAQEDIKTGNGTLKEIFKIQDMIYNRKYGEEQAMTKAIKSNSYDPRTWQGDYSSELHKQLNAAAPTTVASSGFKYLGKE